VTVGDISHADIVYPAGHVLQTQYVYQSSTYSNTGSYTTIITKNITPASTSNLILVHVAARCTWPDGGHTHGWCPCRVTRDGSMIGATLYMGDDTPQYYRQSWISWNFVDTVPAAGSPVTYNFQGSSDYGFAFNVMSAHMTLQEIKG
jgi:hypothetical protein